jgi:hypothetical protein
MKDRLKFLLVFFVRRADGALTRNGWLCPSGELKFNPFFQQNLTGRR